MKKLLTIVTFLLSTGLFFTSCSGNTDNKETTQLGKNETYTCSMHNEVMSDHPGECPKCGMKLVKQHMTAVQQKLMDQGKFVKPKQ